MALATVGSGAGMLAGLMGLALFGLAWLPALSVWIGGGAAGVAGAIALAALPRASNPPRSARPAPAARTA